MIDIEEGADIVMVKPAGSYLDVLADVAAASDIPVWAYQVSGEYAMIEAAAAHGWIDRKRAVIESVRGIRRAGADAVLTYWAVELADWIRRGTSRERSHQRRALRPRAGGHPRRRELAGARLPFRRRHPALPRLGEGPVRHRRRGPRVRRPRRRLGSRDPRPRRPARDRRR
jgi:hypothetical protein